MDKTGKYIIYLLCGAALMLLPHIGFADDSISREYKIKAAYLFNLIKFVNWPAGSPDQPPPESTNICVYGDNPFGTVLDKLNNRKAKGLPIEISYLNSDPSLEYCQIIFIAESNQFDGDLLKQTPDKAQLTVGEDSSFLDQGGLISLVVVNNNVQLQINLTEAKKYGFEISGNLLEIAKTVR